MSFSLNAYAQCHRQRTGFRSNLWIRSHLSANTCFFDFLSGCTKNEQYGLSPETGVDIGSVIIPSTELSTGRMCLSAFGQEQEITRRERGVAEGANADAVTLFGEEKCPVKDQPKFQRTSEQSP